MSKEKQLWKGKQRVYSVDVYDNHVRYNYIVGPMTSAGKFKLLDNKEELERAIRSLQLRRGK